MVYFAEGCFEGGWEVFGDLEYEWIFVDAWVESHCSWWDAFYCAMKVVVDVDVFLIDQNGSFRGQLYLQVDMGINTVVFQRNMFDLYWSFCAQNQLSRKRHRGPIRIRRKVDRWFIEQNLQFDHFAPLSSIRI